MLTPVRADSRSSSCQSSAPKRTVVWCILRVGIVGAIYPGPISPTHSRYDFDIETDIAPDRDTERGEASTDTLGRLSRAFVQLLRQRVGRGPSEVKSDWAGDDVLLVLFGDGFTTAERTLWNHGRSQTARSYRQAVMEALEPEFRALVEQQTERRVVALLSCTHHEPDVMAAVFLLEPLGGSDSSDAGRGDAGGRPASPDLLSAADGRVR